MDKLTRLGEAIHAAKMKLVESRLHQNDRAVAMKPLTLTEELLDELRLTGRVSNEAAEQG
jgi:hypothetical protein